MRKYLKWLIILLLLALIVLVPILAGKNSIFKEVSYVNFKEKINNEEFTFVYIGSPTCSYCIKMRPFLAELKNEYDVTIYYLNYSRLTATQVTDLKALDIRLNAMGTPTFIFIKNRKINGVKVGATDTYEEFKSIFDGYYYDQEN